MTGSDVIYQLGAFLGSNVVVGSDGGVRDLRIDKLNKTASGAQVVVYEIGDTTWACARPTWRASRRFTISLTGFNNAPTKRVSVTFAMNTTLVLPLDSTGAVTAAEVSAHSRCLEIQGTIPE